AASPVAGRAGVRGHGRPHPPRTRAGTARRPPYPACARCRPARLQRAEHLLARLPTLVSPGPGRAAPAADAVARGLTPLTHSDEPPDDARTDTARRLADDGE